MTPGRRQLLKILQVTTTLEVAARCRVTHQAVSQWAAGQTAPSKKSQRALAEHCRVPGPWHEASAAADEKSTDVCK